LTVQNSKNHLHLRSVKRKQKGRKGKPGTIFPPGSASPTDGAEKKREGDHRRRAGGVGTKKPLEKVWPFLPKRGEKTMQKKARDIETRKG